MTRAEKHLYMTCAKFRRRYGGGSPELSIRSRFLKEVPKNLVEVLNEEPEKPQVDLYAERYEVRDAVKKNLYTGKTYNSLDNIAQFFSERGMPPPRGLNVPGAQPRAAVPPTSAAARPAQSVRPAATRKPFGPGSSVRHPKYGRGTVMRREGDGDDAKLTVNFPGYGLKKIVQKYAGITEE
jgi:DNA helicase-2/ATP-dependent DNA helicase PcrA